jgi:hypothetical protein
VCIVGAVDMLLEIFERSSCLPQVETIPLSSEAACMVIGSFRDEAHRQLRGRCANRRCCRARPQHSRGGRLLRRYPIPTLLCAGLLAAFAPCCGDSDSDPDEDGGTSIDQGLDAGRDLGRRPPRDFGPPPDSGSDLGTDWGTPDPGWEFVPRIDCPIQRATDPGATYTLTWESCPAGLPCRVHRLDPRYGGDTPAWPMTVTRSTPGAVPVFVFRHAHSETRLRTAIIANRDGVIHAAWQHPKLDDCGLGLIGSDGISVAMNLHLPDEYEEIYREPINEIAAASEPYRVFAPGELLGPFIAAYHLNDQLLVASFGSSFWAFEGDESTKRATVDEPDPIPVGSHGGVALAGRRMYWATGFRYLVTALGHDGAPEILYQPASDEVFFRQVVADENWLVWQEALGGTEDVTLWAAPREEPPTTLVPRRLVGLDQPNAIGIGEGMLALRQVEPERLVAVEVPTGRTRTVVLPDGMGISNDALWVSAGHAYFGAVLDAPNDPAIIEFDLAAIPYDE